MAEATHLLGLPLKHKPKDIKPQGAGSGLDADKVDGLHASEIGGGGGPHNILSATHLDTLAASVMAGDLLHGNATPKWARLAKGADGQFLKLISGLPAWADPPAGADHNLLSTTHPDTADGTLVDGDLLRVNTVAGLTKWRRLPRGSADQILKIVNNLPTWADPPETERAFWSEVEADPVQMGATVADKTLPDVGYKVPSGVTVTLAYAVLKVRAIENTSSSGDNAVNNVAGINVQVKKSTETDWTGAITALKLDNDQWLTPKLSRESGDVQPAAQDYDITAKIVNDGNVNTLNFRISQAVVDYDFLKLYEVQVGVRIWFR